MRSSRLLLFILFCITICIPIFCVKSSDEWPMFRHDPARTGSSESKAPDTNATRWVISYGEVPGVVIDGKLFTARFCFNASTSEFIRENAILASNNDIYTITVLEGRGYSVICPHLQSSCNIICWNASNGVEIWRYESNKRITSSPLIVENRLYVVLEENWFFCLNATTGKEIWKYGTEYFFLSSPAYLDGKIFIFFQGGYARHTFGGINCFNSLSGELIWNFTTGNVTRTCMTPVIYKNKVFFNMMIFEHTPDNTIYIERLFCINTNNGNEIWEYDFMGVIEISSLAVYNDKLYFGSSDKNIYCLNANTGSIIWNYTTGDAIYSHPAIADNKIFIASSDSLFYCLNATSGDKIWTYKTVYQYFDYRSSPIIANGNLYIAFQNGLHCFGPLLDISLNPTFYDNWGEPLVPQPDNWTLRLPNSTEISLFNETTIHGQVGAYVFSSVIWKGIEILSQKDRSESHNYIRWDQTWAPKINCTLPTETSISLSSNSKIGYTVSISGELSCHNKEVANSDILLLYSVNEGETWNEISQVQTDSEGHYFVVWMPTATGNYVVKAMWRGDEDFPSSEVSTNLVVIPYEDEFVFPVSSNSTISSLVFDSDEKKLHFEVNGSSNTIGYAKVTIPIKLVSNKNKINVYFDGVKIPHQLESKGDSWIIVFTYKHSMHKVVIDLGRKTPNLFIPGFPIESIIVGLFFILIISWLKSHK